MRAQTELAEILGLSGLARKHGQSLRVLIVEDDVAVGELLQGFVRDLGHETELVPSAEAALQRLQRNRPDLVFLDLRLPGMTGLDSHLQTGARRDQASVAPRFAAAARSARPLL